MRPDTLRSSVRLIVVLVVPLLVVPILPGRLDAQSAGPRVFYVVTHEPVTDENRYRGPTAAIWEADAHTETSCLLYQVEPVVHQTPRTLFPASEISLLETSPIFPAGRADDPGIIQGLDRVVLLDTDHLLIVTHQHVHEVNTDFQFGYIDFKVLDLTNYEVISILTIPYHPPVLEASWGCHLMSYRVGVGEIQPNPTSASFAFSLVPTPPCSRVELGQTYLVDYSNLPVQMEELPFVSEFSWSPDGSALAYIETYWPTSSESLGTASTYVRSSLPGSLPMLISQYVPALYYPARITWLDDETILTQSDEFSINEKAYWTAYRVPSAQVVFREELSSGEFRGFGYLHDDRSHLVWGWRAGGLALMQFVDGEVLINDVLPIRYFVDQSRFKEYIFFGLTQTQTEFLRADGSTAILDLTWFTHRVPHEVVDYLIPGLAG